MSRKSNTPEFIVKCVKRYGEKYDYSNVIIKCNKQQVYLH